MDDDADFTILPAPHVISNHTEEIPMVSAIEMDELPESSAVEAWNDDAETSPFLKIEIATVNPETDVVEPLELGDLKSEEIDASHVYGKFLLINQFSEIFLIHRMPI